MTINSFYSLLFRKMGARYCFADELDPWCFEKINRGAQDLNTKIPHWPVEPTTERILSFIDDFKEKKKEINLDYLSGYCWGITEVPNKIDFIVI